MSSRPGPDRTLDLASFRALDQPGASTKPYIFDIDLLDRRAQPLFSHPNYKPIECMIFDRRPWICFYGGSQPTVVAEADDWWYTMYTADGSCCLQGWPMFPLQDFARLFADPPPSPEPATRADDAASCPQRTSSGRGSLSQPTTAHLLEDFGTSDAWAPTTHAPRTRPPDRLQYRSHEACSLKI